MTDQQQTRPSQVVLERRRQLKSDQRALKQLLGRLKDDLTMVENENYLFMAQHTAEEGGFRSKLSDHKGRKAELDIVLSNHADYGRLKKEINETENKIQEIDDALSDINFYQRQRMVLVTDAFIDASEDLVEQLKEFKTAVELFVESRKHRS